MYGTEITTELMLSLGRITASRYRRILVGRDVRTTSQALSKAFISGALASGASVEDCGIVSTPTVAFGAKGFDCGVIITASHNPPEYNGIKFWNPSGMAFDQQQQEEIEKAMIDREVESRAWDSVHESTTRDDLVAEHATAITSAIGQSDLKVVVDCGCGSTGTITPYVLRKMGCKVLTLNAQLDGRFPGRSPEPTEENLALLRKTVPAVGANLGIAHDGDGDRVMAVDETGRFVGGETLLPILASKVAKRSVVVPVDASMAVDDMLPEARIWRTRVGDVYVAQEVYKQRAEFGGEPSGTFIFPRWGLFPDGVYGAAYIVSMVSRERLSDLVSSLPSYSSLRGTFKFDRSHRTDIVEVLNRNLSIIEGATVETIDGWRVKFKDGWGLVRLSGTEPKVRVLAEARNESRTKEIYEYLVSKTKAGLK